MSIKKVTQYTITLPESLKSIFKDGTAYLDDKSLHEFHRALDSFTSEISDAVGSMNFKPERNIVRQRKKRYASVSTILSWAKTLNKAFTAQEAADMLNLSNSNTHKILDYMVQHQMLNFTKVGLTHLYSLAAEKIVLLSKEEN